MEIRENPDCVESGAAQDKELEELSVEEMFERLDGIIRKLEDGKSSLEDAFTCYESGMRLVKACAGKIDRVEKQILVVNGQEMEEQA